MFCYFSRRLQATIKLLGIAAGIACFAMGGISVASAQQHIEARDGEINMPEWSPDGQHVAFSASWDGDWDVYILEVASGKVRQLTHNEEVNDFHPMFSNDGRKIYYSSNERGDYNAHVINLETGQSEYLFGELGVSETHPQEILGGKISFNLGTRKNGRKLALWDPNTGEVEVVSEGPMVDGQTTVNEWGVWSPTGNIFAYGSDRNNGDGFFFDLYYADWDGSNERQYMALPPDHEGFGAVVDAIFPDGKRILSHGDKGFEAFDPHLYIYDITTNTETVLPRPDFAISFPSLSRDGTMLVIETDVDDDGLFELVVMDINIREAHEIWPKKRKVWPSSE